MSGSRAERRKTPGPRAPMEAILARLASSHHPSSKRRERVLMLDSKTSIRSASSWSGPAWPGRGRREHFYERIRGRWPDVYAAAGVPPEFLRLRRPGPCPLCRAGTDRYTFDDRHGDGDYYCRRCGAGKGLRFLTRWLGVSWGEAANRALQLLGEARMGGRRAGAARAARPVVGSRLEGRPGASAGVGGSSALQRALRCWHESVPVAPGDPVDRYLRGRLPMLRQVPDVIRHHPALEYFEPSPGQGRAISHGRHPVMVCKVVDATGQFRTVHRTYLRGDGSKLCLRSALGQPLAARKLMPSVRSSGAAVRLTDAFAEHLAIAEGVETALAGCLLSGIPTWSVLSASGIASFVPPADVRILTVFADNDLPDAQGRRAGIDAVARLVQRPDVAQRVSSGQLRVVTRMPMRRGWDIANLMPRPSRGETAGLMAGER